MSPIRDFFIDWWTKESPFWLNCSTITPFSRYDRKKNSEKFTFDNFQRIKQHKFKRREFSIAFPAFLYTKAPTRGSGGQNTVICMKLSTLASSSILYICSLKRSARKVRKNGQQKTCNLFCNTAAKRVEKRWCAFYHSRSNLLTTWFVVRQVWCGW